MPPRVFAIMSWLSASIELPSSRCHDPCRRSAATAFKHHRGVVRGPSLVALVVAGRASARAPGRTAAPPCLTGSVHAAKKSRRLGSGPVVDLVVAGRAGAKLRRRARLGPSRCASLDPSSFSSSPRKQAHRGAAVRPIEPLRRMGWPATAALGGRKGTDAAIVVKLTSRGIGIYISAEALRNCTQPPSPSSAACAPASLRGLGGSLLPLDPRPSPLSPVSPFSLTSLLSLPPPSRRACRFGGARSNLIPCPMILSLWIVIVPGAVPGSRAESGRAGAPCFPAPS